MPEEFGKVKTSLDLSGAFISRRLCSHKHKPSVLMFQLQILALCLSHFCQLFTLKLIKDRAQVTRTQLFVESFS